MFPYELRNHLFWGTPLENDHVLWLKLFSHGFSWIVQDFGVPPLMLDALGGISSGTPRLPHLRLEPFDGHQLLRELLLPALKILQLHTKHVPKAR